MVAFLFPLLYCLCSGCAWAFIFRRRLIESLAPALITQCLLVLVSGIVFTSLLPGLFSGIIFTIGVIIWFFKNKKEPHKLENAVQLLRWSDILLFIGLFVFLYVMSTGKRFNSWDEWSHWGRFWKESLRLDALFVTSDADMAHQDYVPGATLFQYIWSRIAFRQVEADAYRAQQILMLSMLLPVLIPLLNKTEKQQVRETKEHYHVRLLSNMFIACGGIIILLFIPLFFKPDLGFQFYHSVYCDYIFGVVLFYAFWECFRNEQKFVYQILTATLALAFLVLTKMTAIVFLPMIIPVLIVNVWVFHRERIKLLRRGALFLIPLAVPVIIWMVYNVYAHFAMGGGQLHAQAGTQSYGTVDFKLIWNIFFHPEESGIPFIIAVKENYLWAIHSYPILLHTSYSVTLAGVTIAIAVVAVLSRIVPEDVENGITKGRRTGKILLSACWVFLAGIANALMMYYLYCTAFGEYEATNLASFARYMDTYLVGAVLILFAIWIYSGVAGQMKVASGVIAFILVIDLLCNPSAFAQMKPGRYSGDEEMLAPYVNFAGLLREVVDEKDSIYIMSRGDNGLLTTILGYYLLPRHISGGSIGPEVYQGDIWSADLSVGEFVERVGKYDWICLVNVDDVFVEQYSGAFPEDFTVESGMLYHIISADLETGKLELELPK